MVKKVLKYFLDKHKFGLGDSVRMENGDSSYTVVGTFYTTDLKPVMMIRSDDGKLFTAYEDLYKHDD